MFLRGVKRCHCVGMCSIKPIQTVNGYQFYKELIYECSSDSICGSEISDFDFEAFEEFDYFLFKQVKPAELFVERIYHS